MKVAKIAIMLTGGILAMVCIADVTLAEEIEYTAGRYDLILDRSPFGADPLLDTGSPAQRNAAAVAAAAKELRLCFLLESEGGEVRAGFHNLKASPGDPKSVILRVGESFMGMKLLEVDLVTSEATLESGGEPVVFELTRASVPAAKVVPNAAAAKAAATRAAAAKPATPQRRFGGGDWRFQNVYMLRR